MLNGKVKGNRKQEKGKRKREVKWSDSAAIQGAIRQGFPFIEIMTMMHQPFVQCIQGSVHVSNGTVN